MSKREIVSNHRMVLVTDTLVLVDKRLFCFPEGLFDLSLSADVFDLLHVAESVTYWRKDLVVRIKEKANVGQYQPKVTLESIEMSQFLEILSPEIQQTLHELGV